MQSEGGSHKILPSTGSPDTNRSASIAPSPSSPRRTIVRSGPTSASHGMTTIAHASGLPPSRLQLESEELSTLPDPRSPGDDFPSPRKTDSPSPSLDLNGEVAMLTNKLISAINHQTNLDDTLAATRQKLETAEERVRQLEAENQDHAKLVASGVLVKKEEAEEQANKLVVKLAEERKRRTVVEKDKKGMEQELENLTTALFEEANEMVAAARKEREAAERRTEQVRAQLNDTELLLASHQEQLAELKVVMENIHAERDNLEQTTNGSTAPSTPALPSQGDVTKAFDALHISPRISEDNISPAPPTSFSYLLSPILRTDLQSYEDFRVLLQITRKSAPGSRVNSGSYSGVNVLGLSNAMNREGYPHSAHLPSNGSTTSLSTPGTFNPSPGSTPNTPASTISGAASPLVQLKETRFYKRALTEDIEPTLRLDTAPGLSWLARRTVINSMCEGSLVVEPMPTSNKMMHVFPCALCGESRKGDEFSRTHRFRTSESENAQRYPLCGYCLNRVRATCDYLGFLRMVKDGHWRTEGAENEKMAWEESVRLRERMFWARIGGGVVPTFIPRDSPRESGEGMPLKTPFSAPPVLGAGPRNGTVSEENGEPFHLQAKRASIGQPVISRKQSHIDVNDEWEMAKNAAIFDDIATSLKSVVDPPSRQLHTNLRDSLKPRSRSRAASYERERSKPPSRDTTPQQVSTPVPAPTLPLTNDGGLQISIPGAF